VINKTSTTLISIEGLDCSFKETNVAALKKQLEKDGYSVLSYDFPQYNRNSSYFVRSFLNNPIYRDPEPLTIEDCCKYCIYYGLDRYDTYLNDIKDNMGKVDVILFDRYVTSNLHNAARMLPDKYSALEVLEWFYRFDYDILRLPQEDLSIFLRMPYETSKIIRSAKAGKDLNESDEEFCKKSYEMFDMVYTREIKESKYDKNFSYTTDFIKQWINDIMHESILGNDIMHESILGIAPMTTGYVDLDADGIDYVKTLTDVEERNKSKEIIFSKIMDQFYGSIKTIIDYRRKEYGKPI